MLPVLARASVFYKKSSFAELVFQVCQKANIFKVSAKKQNFTTIIKTKTKKKFGKINNLSAV